MPPKPKSPVLILFCAFVVAAAVNSFMVVLLASNYTRSEVSATVHTIEPAIYVAASVALAASLYVALVKMEKAPDLAQFQTLMILSLALAHACTVFGMLLFFLGHRPEAFWPFPVLTVLVELLFILPRVLHRVQS